MILSDKLQSDKEIVMAAVKQNAYALTYASDSLKDDKDIVIAAIKQDAGAYIFASDRLRQDEDVMHAAEMQLGMECRKKEGNLIKTKKKEINNE